MDHVIHVLPHCVWALATVVCVYRYVAKRSSDRWLRELEEITEKHELFLASTSDAINALGADLKKLQYRQEKLEQVPARKQVF